MLFFFFKQKTAYEMRISDWSSDVCSSDLLFVDVLDVALALVLGDGVAHVVDVEAQRLGEVVEALELQARQGLDHGGHSSRFRWTKGELCAQPAGRRKGLRLLDERSEEHTSELQSLMSSSYAVFCLKKKTHI